MSTLDDLHEAVDADLTWLLALYKDMEKLARERGRGESISFPEVASFAPLTVFPDIFTTARK